MCGTGSHMNKKCHVQPSGKKPHRERVKRPLLPCTRSRKFHTSGLKTGMSCSPEDAVYRRIIPSPDNPPDRNRSPYISPALLSRGEDDEGTFRNIRNIKKIFPKERDNDKSHQGTTMNTENDDIPKTIKVFDPPVNISDDSRHIRVIVSLPGVTEEQVSIDHRGQTLIVTVHNKKILLQKVIAIPPAERIFKRKFFNGVLDISLEK